MPNFGDLFGGSNIKSIQRGVVSIAGNSDSATVAITPVNPAYAELRGLGSTFSSGSAQSNYGAYPVLSGGGTSVTVYSGQNFGNSSYVTKLSWEITEYYPS